jgi:hypothetical protein
VFKEIRKNSPNFEDFSLLGDFGKDNVILAYVFKTEEA